MSFEDLNTYILGIPIYKFTPTIELYSTLHKIPLERQVIVSCSNVRQSRGRVIAEFFQDFRLNSNVLVFCDIDTVCSIGQIENLVINCTEETPFISACIPYRQRSLEKIYNFFFENDINQIKKNKILEEKPFIFECDFSGFGLVAIHRSLLNKMTEKYGHVVSSNSIYPNLFSEYVDYGKVYLSDELIKRDFINKHKNITDDLYTELKPVIEKMYKENSKVINILPETFSFCKRAREVGGRILVMLKNGAGHLSDKILKYES